MATFNVILRGKNKKGEASVYITFYLQSQKIEIPARFTIPISAFDKKKGIIKSSYEFSEDRNLILQDIKARAN
ncbi:MAG: site-specific integrase, partial [Porphyromonadaceae bacterium]|nr:site-specific integrase [Porphyromonadaceae bacterium]